MKVKKILALGLAAVMTFTLSACGGKEGGSSNSNTDSTGSAETEKGGEDSGGSLVIYTNSGSDGRDAWLKDYASRTDSGRRPWQPDCVREKQCAGRSCIWLK